jgi:hypothetical protein
MIFDDRIFLRISPKLFTGLRSRVHLESAAAIERERHKINAEYTRLEFHIERRIDARRCIPSRLRSEPISQTLQQGKPVKVLVATPEALEWQELPVNTAAGLVAGLIEMIRPSWDIKGAITRKLAGER